jgi:membrane protein implicated in regulation of membrane protease activity
MILAAITSLGPWAWIVLGLVLAAAEMLAPGVFLIWLGLAAVLTGVVDGLFGLSWHTASLLFAALSVVSVAAGWRFTRRPNEDAAEQPFLNRRGAALVGQVFTLETPIEKGEGKVRVGDSFWRITGPDAPIGAQVRVTRVDGATLVVEPV